MKNYQKKKKTFLVEYIIRWTLDFPSVVPMTTVKQFLDIDQKTMIIKEW